MTAEALARILVALELEHRPSVDGGGVRVYDEQSPSHLIHPNGSLVDSFDRAFLGAAGREVLALYGVPRAPKEHAA